MVYGVVERERCSFKSGVTDQRHSLRCSLTVLAVPEHSVKSAVLREWNLSLRIWNRWQIPELWQFRSENTEKSAGSWSVFLSGRGKSISNVISFFYFPPAFLYSLVSTFASWCLNWFLSFSVSYLQKKSELHNGNWLPASLEVYFAHE